MTSFKDFMTENGPVEVILGEFAFDFYVFFFFHLITVSFTLYHVLFVYAQGQGCQFKKKWQGSY